MTMIRPGGPGAAALLLAASLHGAHAADTPKVLGVANPFAPLSLDPALSGNGRAGTFLLPAYEPLVRTRADGTLEPALASAWTLSPDNRVATFTLRPDAKFSDGTPVDAAAAKKSIDYWRGKKGPFALNLATVTSVDVLGPDKFSVTVSEGNPNLISLFDAYWLSGDLISPKALETPDILGTQSFGAGPYKIDTAASVTGKTYTYVPNPYYYDKSKIYWDKITIGAFEDSNSAIQAMRAGQLKLLVSDALTGHTNAASLPPNIHIVSDPVQWTGLILNDRDGVTNPALKDVRVRQAINFGLDRKLINKALFGDLGEATDQLQGRGFMGYSEANEVAYPYDPAKAKALLAEAGYPKGFTLTIGYVNNTLSALLSQAIAGQLKKIGLTVKTVEFQNLGAMDNAMQQKQYESIVFNSNFGVPNLAKFQTLDARGSLNEFHTTDADLTALIVAASALPVDKAEDAWKKVYARVVDLAWFAPVSALHVTYFAADTIVAPKPGQSLVIDLTRVTPAH